MAEGYGYRWFLKAFSCTCCKVRLFWTSVNFATENRQLLHIFPLISFTQQPEQMRIHYCRVWHRHNLQPNIRFKWSRKAPSLTFPAQWPKHFKSSGIHNEVTFDLPSHYREHESNTAEDINKLTFSLCLFFFFGMNPEPKTALLS